MDHLQRHAAAERHPLGLVDDSHPTAADLAEDLVVAEPIETRESPVLIRRAKIRCRGPRALGTASAGAQERRGRHVASLAGLFHLDQRWKQVEDLGGVVGVAIGIFLDRGPFPVAEPRSGTTRGSVTHLIG